MLGQIPSESRVGSLTPTQGVVVAPRSRLQAWGYTLGNIKCKPGTADLVTRAMHPRVVAGGVTTDSLRGRRDQRFLQQLYLRG